MEYQPKWEHFDIKECLACDGYRYPCNHYASMTRDEQCNWYKVVDNDIQKMREGDGSLTFPDLGEIIRLNGK